MSVVHLIKGHDLFRSLSPEEVDRISLVSSAKSFAAGATVHTKGRPASHVFVLLQGQVRLSLPAAEGEFSLVVANVAQGELFGVAALLGSERYTTTARCLSESQVLAIEAAPLLAVLRANHHANQAVVSNVARVYFGRYEALLGRLQGILNQMAG